MDPPTSSSSLSVSKDGGLKHPSTPKTANESHPPSSTSKNIGPTTTGQLFPQPPIIRAQQQFSATTCYGVHNKNSKSRNAAKIIKGEIHNVLTVMRSDPRYYSTGEETKKNTKSRFEYEERQQQLPRVGGGGGRFWKSGGGGGGNNINDQDWKVASNSSSGTISSHPILQGLRDLHDLLSVMEIEGNASNIGISSSSTSSPSSQKTKFHQSMDAVTFVSPFASAVSSQDVDAKTTGEALSALHKFIVYGFIGGHDNDDEENKKKKNRFPFSSSSDKVRESISVVAQCIRHCSFEDSSKSSSTPKGKRMLFSFWSSNNNSERQQRGDNSILGQSESTIDGAPSSNHHELPSFLIQSRRTQKSQGGKDNTMDRRSKPYSSLSATDEDVVLKLLSLSVQVLRCPAGQHLLSPRDVIGIFDTCLYVALAAGETNRTLLRSAAADALSHCVIVVFGMRGHQSRKNKNKNHNNSDYRNNGGLGDDITDDATNDDDDATEDDSDDDWGERDPTEDLTKTDALRARTSPTKQNGDTIANVPNMPDSSSKLEGDESNTNNSVQEEEPALVPIMHRLATLADPLINEDDTCVLALSLINIALETMTEIDALSVRYPRLLNILQNDLCRNLLRLSTSPDLSILGLALRVIYNLFDGIKDHLKVQLEVFLTSVHLRTLSFSTSPNSKERVWSSSPERRELALESLLEFCREPMLMMDLYLNYDCDISCTNLYETICSTLARVANPEDESFVETSHTENNSDTASEGSSNIEGDGSDSEQYQKPRLNILNRLALEGVLAVIDGISRRCRTSSKYEASLSEMSQQVPLRPLHSEEDILCPSPPDSGNSAFLGNTLYIRNDPLMEGPGSVSSEYDFCSVNSDSRPGLQRYASEASAEMEWLSKARHHTSLALRERKLRKRRIAKAAVEFNERSKDKEWMAEVEHLGILPTPATAAAVASFLHSTPKLDKTKIGLYLSKGPKDKYPFHSEVLDCFASLFDFTGMSFSEALRTFLHSFRLPGEAQCIDRLMESFAKRLYEVQLSGNISGKVDQSVEETMLDPPRRGNSDSEFSGRLDPPSASEEVGGPTFPFKSSDAAFILSFSTIMLNTDLHNPNMKDEKRMTVDQFVRNNRGINEGKDLPLAFLTDLYYDIKTNEIQMKQDIMQDVGGGLDAFDGLLANNANDVATPFFTSNHNMQNQAGVHERDMFVAIYSSAMNAISAVFVESWDDVLVTKALDGMQASAYICSYFGLHEQFNHVLELLLGLGLDYVGSVSSLMYTPPEGVQSDIMSTTSQANTQENELASMNIPPLPKSFLNTLGKAASQKSHIDLSDMTGSAAHRGLLSLQCALTLSKYHLSFVNEAWPLLLDVMFALRDVNALPPRLSEVDDFADSLGNPLPMSVFANRSQQRVNEYMESLAPTNKSEEKSGFLSSMFFGFGHSQHNGGNHAKDRQHFPLSETLQNVADCAQLDKIIMKTNDSGTAKRILCAMLAAVFPEREDGEELLSDPNFEHNSVFVLELAARLLISNRTYATELYPIFLAKFQQLMSPQSEEEEILGLKFPFILERIVVTILRACIHLFDVPEASLRDQLNRSLKLIAALPSSYTRAISNRIGCGTAIILRGCFYLFDDSADDWSTIKSLLDLSAQDKSSRGFVFDGIASVIDSIDYAIPSATDSEEGHAGGDNSNELQLSQSGVKVMASLLLKFMNGSYEGDVSFKVAATMYIQKVYGYSQHFADKGGQSEDGSVTNDAHLEENEFDTMVFAIYNDACLSQDGDIAKRGFESLQGVVLSTKVDSLPVDKWFAFLKLVATNPPSIEIEKARISSLALIGRLFLNLMPELSNQKSNWSELEDWTICVASMVNNNLQAGRATSLFETTVQTVTNVVNVMSMSGFNDGEGVNFCSWVGETLLYELEKVGASGGVFNAAN